MWAATDAELRWRGRRTLLEPTKGGGNKGGRLGASDDLVGEESEAVTDGLGADEAHRLLVGGPAEEALAGPEHDREDDEAQLVNEVVLDQGVHQLVAGVDKDLTADLLLQLRNSADHLACDDGRVGPFRIARGRGHDVLRHAVQLVGPRAAARQPPRGEPLVASPPQQQRVGAQCLLGLDTGPPFEVLSSELAEPAAEQKALLAVGVLDDAIERDVGSDDDLSHLGSPFSVGVVTVTNKDTATRGNWAPPGRPVRPWSGVYRRMGPRQVSGGDATVGTVDLITMARAGDGDAFEKLTQPYRRELQVHCYRMLGSFQDAEDVLQDTLLAAWQGLGGFEERASLRTWLYRIATNRCLNGLRSAGRRQAKQWDMPGIEPPEPTRSRRGPWARPYPDTLLGGAGDQR